MTTASTPSIVSPVLDPLADRDSMAAALRLVEREAENFLAGVDEALVRPTGSPTFDGRLPDAGTGSLGVCTSARRSSRTGSRFGRRS